MHKSSRSLAAAAEDATVTRFFSSDLRNLYRADVTNVVPVPPVASWKNSRSVLAFLEDSSPMLLVIAPGLTAPTTFSNTSRWSSVKRETDSISIRRSSSDEHFFSMLCCGSRFRYKLESPRSARVNWIVVETHSPISNKTYDRAYSSVCRTG